MKKSTIWAIASVMGISFLSLLYLQTRYMQEVIDIRREQIEAVVTRSMAQAARDIEIDETQERLRKQSEVPKDFAHTQSLDDVEKKFANFHTSSGIPKAFLPENFNDSSTDEFKTKIREAYLYKKGLLDEVAYAALYKSSDQPLARRVVNIDSKLKQAFINNGLRLSDDFTYHYVILNANGDTIVQCSDYDPQGSDNSFRQELFEHDPRPKMGVLYVHFPNMQKYIFLSVRFIIPAILFTLVLLCMFVFTIYTIFRQKKLTEIKNDFINNMTHEFKTPISTISLAAQMLQDPSVTKSEDMLKHLSGIINDETKRLRFQVEKVLQMSMFDEKGGTFKRKEVDLNNLLKDVTDTFRLKVETNGGNLSAHLDAADTIAFVDQMHMTNVIFNLLDNAIKYKSADRKIELTIQSYNKGDKIYISIQDNGIGVKKEDLKKIFEKFYRSHTGNRHDVKGFGLGLAYVKKVIDYHKGNIHAESDYGRGTKFIISLPIIKKS
ncbi:hypothetical protein HMPREF9332_00089 [Alloprevotella rava F0323]|uniref:histidine kinase n=1 Tax=Alloprevotella rava F0323 TaxID=679199 RepID=G5G939_9BACT|nr:HAMP domain-containing sensor histidine kinase [Alloprevotella rava]EHG24824.1 hypothetical protein HMPREF9332_00089 [Alloprevotella rava F0323]